MAPKKNLIEHYDDGNLDLSLSSIQDVPVRDIAAIPKAINLDLSCNTIVSLPKTFATSLSHLVKLDLSKNQITSLPENFGLLVNLKHLDLDSNKIESLPLSFGNLKSLRWLDLKQNPLMPKLAQIAGLCLDAKQCQAAAKNVVAALRTMQEQVDMEISRRKEKQLKKLEKSEEAARNQIKENQQSKKKKKKASKTISVHANGQTHPSDGVEEENVLQDQTSHKSSLVPPIKTVQKPGLFGKVGRVLGGIVKFVVMCALLAVFSGFLLSLINEDLYKDLRTRVNQVIQTNVPKHYLQQWDRGMLITRRAVESWSGQLIAISVHYFHKAQDYYAAVSNDEAVLQYLDSIKSGWHILWIWISETYTTLSHTLPNYFNYVKNVIIEFSATKS